MKDLICLVVSNQRFHLTPQEAKFLAQHLHTAVNQPNLALHLTRQRSEHSGSIEVLRGPGITLTDC
ncbi:hypothetical protein [Stenotrophomonas sp. B1-1]|uniref:hypothetical protein n=1 Tax=Stenotrophomonas sp. B1-1 TaxID=2710648 RepID=UPI0013D94F9F|nr:hypothetical protein [Stenotrophomonas sp. B1-1]